MPNPDLSDFKARGRREQRKPCKVAAALEAVAEEHRQLVLDALQHDDEDIRRGVKDWLKEQDVDPPSVAALTHHKARECRCHG